MCPRFLSTLAAFVALLDYEWVNGVSNTKGRADSLHSFETRLLGRSEGASLAEETGKTIRANSGGHSGGDNAQTSLLSLQQRGQDTAEDVTEECIAAHNEKRVGKLKVPLIALQRNADAIYQALSYMKKVVANGCPFEHSHSENFGENLFATGAPVATCSDAVGAWYKEIEYFNGKYPGGDWSMETGHFTQVMWSESTGLGCARTLGCEDRRILVCNYTPPGNYVGVAPFSEEVWDSIMESSAGFSPIAVTSVNCILLTLVASITSLAITAA